MFGIRVVVLITILPQITEVLRDVIAMRDCRSRSDYRQLVRQLSQSTPTLSSTLDNRAKAIPDKVVAKQLTDCAIKLDTQLPTFIKASRMHVTGSRIGSGDVDFSRELKSMTAALVACRKLVDDMYVATGGVDYSRLQDAFTNLAQAVQNNDREELMESLNVIKEAVAKSTEEESRRGRDMLLDGDDGDNSFGQAGTNKRSERDGEVDDDFDGSMFSSKAEVDKAHADYDDGAWEREQAMKRLKDMLSNLVGAVRGNLADPSNESCNENLTCAIENVRGALIPQSGIGAATTAASLKNSLLSCATELTSAMQTLSKDVENT